MSEDGNSPKIKRFLGRNNSGGGSTTYRIIKKQNTAEAAAAAAKSSDPLVGTKLADNYQILSVLGQGGMSVVYKARHEVMDRIVAVKMLLEQETMDSTIVKRFEREAKAVSRLNHPHLITVYDFGFSGGNRAYFVMEFLQGRSLEELLKERKQLTPEEAGPILEQVCDALDHAHKKGVIHRDLKPGNIMLVKEQDQDNFVKVVDFGIAKLKEDTQKLTKTGEVWGSPVYMSPEQCMGKQLDPYSDIYSLGIVVYEMLTGRPPFESKSVGVTLSRQVNDPPPDFSAVRPELNIPPQVEKVVRKALEKNPADRFQSMRVFKEELLFAIEAARAAAAGSENVPMGFTPKPTGEYMPIQFSTTDVVEQHESEAPPAKPEKKGDMNRVLIAALIVVILALVATVGWFVYESSTRGGGSQQSIPL